jgi:O-antigen ligase
MRKFLAWLDEIAGIETENTFPKWLERSAFLFLILMIVSAPHSIAATQTAWIVGTVLWLLRAVIKPRPRFFRTPLDIALWAFFGWSIVSAVFSYAPDISIDRLRGVILFLIFYFVVNNLRNIRAVKFMASALILSCMVNVIWTPIERIVGRGIEVSGVKTESVFTKGKAIEGVAIADGDTITEVDKKKIHTPEQLIAALEQKEISRVKFYRPDFYSVLEVRRVDLSSGENALERLGFSDWKHSRNWRSAGFYGHYTTYAEVLQLIASLVFGLFIALDKKRSRIGLILLFCLGGMLLALLLTVTRASQFGFLISAFAIVLANGSRKMLLTLTAIVLPLALVGLVFLQQSRNVGFFDTKDDSTKWRQTVWREGFDLWTKSPRHFFLGVGMDSIQRFKGEWHLFDDGKLPTGHFHSTPLQLAVERGLPALLLWLFILWIYARTLLRNLRFQVPDTKFRIENPQSVTRSPHLKDWQTRGSILGSFGGMIGFLTGGLAHNNIGDAEVLMVFFMLMGLSVSLCSSRFQIVKL